MIACNVSEGSCESRLCRHQVSFAARVPVQSRQEVGFTKRVQRNKSDEAAVGREEHVQGSDSSEGPWSL